MLTVCSVHCSAGELFSKLSVERQEINVYWMTFICLGDSLTRFLQLYTLDMVIGAIIHYQEFGYAVIQLYWRVLSVWSRWVLGCMGECTDRVGACS